MSKKNEERFFLRGTPHQQRFVGGAQHRPRIALCLCLHSLEVPHLQTSSWHLQVPSWVEQLQLEKPLRFKMLATDNMHTSTYLHTNNVT